MWGVRIQRGRSQYRLRLGYDDVFLLCCFSVNVFHPGLYDLWLRSIYSV